MRCMKENVLVIGASTHPERYAHKAIHLLLDEGHRVYAIGGRSGTIRGVTIHTAAVPLEHIDTVTLYLNPSRQQLYFAYIVQLKPKRVIFNPGAENEAFAKQLSAHGIKSETACTLVLLKTKQFDAY